MSRVTTRNTIAGAVARAIEDDLRHPHQCHQRLLWKVALADKAPDLETARRVFHGAIEAAIRDSGAMATAVRLAQRRPGVNKVPLCQAE